MESSDALDKLRKLTAEENSQSSSDPILAKFKDIAKKLEVYTNPESIALRYLEQIFTEWQVLKKKNKSMKRFFSFHSEAQMNEESAILSELEKLVLQISLRPTNLLPFDDPYPLCKPHRNTCIEYDVSGERRKQMVNWLVTSSFDDFTVIGIYGICGCGKTALVKNVLEQKSVGDKFKNIIWACLSQLTCEEEIDDDGIIKYLLHRLGLDADSLVGNMDEDKDWLMEELGRRLRESGNYILVFDDMWHCSPSFVDNFLRRLKKKGGGAVIVTSRRKSVAEKIGDKNMLIHLNPCDDDYKESAFSKAETKDLGK